MRARAVDRRVRRSLFSLRGYALFFLLISFVVSCCFLLFLEALQEALGARLTQAQIAHAATITFGNVLFLSLLCTLLDGIRRRISVRRPVERILGATRRLTQGDFSARIEPLHRFEGMNEFDAIIEDFNRMAQELSGIETLRTDFVASVSHELKTPLSIMQNYATLLQAPGLPEAQRLEYARAITAATRSLSELITNILRLSKLENQQIFPAATSFELGEHLRECLLRFEEAWEEKGLAIEPELEEGVSVRADAELLSLIWNNLFSNAIKFTEPGGTIRVRLTTQGEYAVVTVEDTGCGIPPEVGRRIFEKFYQGDTAHAAQGNGLGLALVRRVVDILGGEISVTSRVGEGSAFTVRLRREAS